MPETSKRRRFRSSGFSLTELLVVLVLSSVVVSGVYNFLQKQRKATTSERMKADVESLAQIAFFIMGRDIRRAGSNPKGWNEYPAGEAIAFEVASQDRLIIRADLDGDGTVGSLPEEIVTYEYADDADDADNVKDHILRQAGNELVIENVRAFEFCYELAMGPPCVSNAPDPSVIRKVQMTMIAGTGHTNSATGLEDRKEIKMTIRPRNFDL